MSTGSRHLERCPAPAAPASSSTASSRSRTASGRHPPERGTAAAIPPHGGHHRLGRASSAPRGEERGRREAEPFPGWARPVTAPPPGANRRQPVTGAPRRGPPHLTASEARPLPEERPRLPPLPLRSTPPGGHPFSAWGGSAMEALTPGEVR